MLMYSFKILVCSQRDIDFNLPVEEYGQNNLGVTALFVGGPTNGGLSVT